MAQIIIAKDADKRNLKNEYQNAVTTLESHITFNTQGMTQAQVVNALVVAVRYQARVLLYILKFIAKNL